MDADPAGILAFGENDMEMLSYISWVLCLTPRGVRMLLTRVIGSNDRTAVLEYLEQLP